MKHNQCTALLFLYLLCLGIMLSGIVLADDQSGQTETYGAYPGAPVSTSSPTPTPSVVTPAQVVITPAASPSGQPTAFTPPVTAYPGPVTSTSTTAVTAIYTPQAPPVTQQNVVLSYNVQTTPPTAVYYSGTFMPWTSFYQVFPASSPALWVSSSAGWSWYATCPIGNWVQELMYIPYTGSMKIYELYPDGTTKDYSYGWVSPGYNYAWFNADTPGRHIEVVTVSGIPSNYITMDVA